MTTIISEDNKLIKHASKLKEKKYRDLYGEYLIEGLRGISDTPDDYIKTIFVSEGAPIGCLNRAKIVEVNEKIIKKLSLADTASGYVAIAAKKEETEISSDKLIYLDRIRDPGNMGSIIRTAVAAGYEVICDDCVDVYNPKVVRSCVSALSKVKFHNGNFIDMIAEKGYNIIGADMGGSNFFESDKPDRLCIVIGNEANGIRKDILARCQSICSVPMEGMESLNASVCAGILMYYFKF